MSIMAQPYKCDAPGCDRVRDNDSNHWWLVFLTRGRGARPREYRIELRPWDDGMATQPFTKHYCGVEHAMSEVALCAQKIIDEKNREEKPHAA